jgi:hypothetical protein
MADVVYLAVIVTFFALCVVFVRACDAIIGPDEAPPMTELGDGPERADAAAPADATHGDSSAPAAAGAVSS